MSAARRASLAAMLVIVVAAAPVLGASRVLPGLRFRVLNTPHFRVYYHQGGETLARRLADVAEAVHASLPARLGLPAPSVTHVLLVDQDDEANGWATPLPYNTVMLTAVWPAPSEIVGHTNDWLRLVFTHEYTHVLHLHQSRGWAGVVRTVFGRAPLAFPNLFLPQWTIEGLATYEETRETGQGRMAAGDALAVVAERTRQIGHQPLDQLNGGQVDWPGGLGAYLYGASFTDYLAARFGERKLGELARRSAGRLPYLQSPAFRATFGEGLGDLWKSYQDTLRTRRPAAPACEPADTPGPASTASGLPGCRRLTRHGYYVTSPRVTADGRAVVYGTSDSDDLPALRLSAIGEAVPEGQRARPSVEARKIATRFGGEQLSVAGGIAYFDQADYEANVAWRSDLYAVDLATGRVQRLTRGARLAAPDVSPDGRRLAAIETRGGERRLRVFDVTGDRVGRLHLAPSAFATAGDDHGVYGAPRWSPSSDRVAAERTVRAGPSEIVVVDPAAGTVRVATTSAAGRNLTPSWMPDGRSLLFASDREGGEFGLYAVSLDSDETRPVLAVAGGALSPVVSADGRRVVYVGYTADGYDIFEAGLDVPPNAATVEREDARNASAGAVERAVPAPPPAGTTSARSTAYSPLPTLLPRAWSPAGDVADGDVRVGLSSGGLDVLGRHAYGVTALWRIEGGENAIDGPHRGRPDWSAFYVYDRWRPAMFVSASDETSFLPQRVAGDRGPDAELRQRSLAVGLSIPLIRLRRSQTLYGAFNAQRDTLQGTVGRRTYRRNSVRAAWAFNSAHVFGRSISPEQGVALAVTSEQVRNAFGADGRADAFTGEVRGYRRAGGRHAVVAARMAVGVANGDANVARVFYLGGPQGAGGLVDFGASAFSMLRGFESKEFAASHVGVANLEYRFPLLRVGRGRGTWPLFLRTLHAAVFADAGQVWDHRFSWSETKGSFGAELSLDAVVGFGLPLTLSAGVARPWDGDRFRNVAAYVRLGRAF